MARVLVYSADPVGPEMAGPGIRAYHFARELAARFDVTLAAPGGPVDTRTLGVRALTRLALAADAVVAQRLPLLTMRALARSDVRVVYDLYVPTTVEALALLAGQPEPLEQRRRRYRETVLVQELALLAGDAFICASERQRDLWLGALGHAGRLDLEAFRGDTTLRSLIDVVPFGVEQGPPPHDGPALRGVVPGIGESDHILLWGGGIWNWFDPLTLVRAMKEVAARRDDVKLVFLGARHPSPEVAAMSMTEQAVDLARELGLEGRTVFFNPGWVPYAERAAYLLDADLGVSCHFDSVETRFAFRTRLLDYLWAGLPIVTTGGDVLADLVEERRLGRTVGAGDVAAWVEAVEALLDDREVYDAARRNVEAVREDFAWPAVVEPLIRLLEAPAASPRTRALEPALARSAWAGLRASLAARGAAGTAAALARRLS